MSTSDPDAKVPLVHTHGEHTTEGHDHAHEHGHDHSHEHGHDHTHDHEHDKPKVSVYINEAEELRKAGSCCPNMAPFVLMMALSVHAIFEGLAVGIAGSFDEASALVLAICIHKGAEGSALGISLVKTFPDDKKTA